MQNYLENAIKVLNSKNAVTPEEIKTHIDASINLYLMDPRNYYGYINTSASNLQSIKEIDCRYKEMVFFILKKFNEIPAIYDIFLSYNNKNSEGIVTKYMEPLCSRYTIKEIYELLEITKIIAHNKFPRQTDAYNDIERYVKTKTLQNNSNYRYIQNIDFGGLQRNSCPTIHIYYEHQKATPRYYDAMLLDESINLIAYWEKISQFSRERFITKIAKITRVFCTQSYIRYGESSLNFIYTLENKPHFIDVIFKKEMIKGKLREIDTLYQLLNITQAAFDNSYREKIDSIIQWYDLDNIRLFFKFYSQYVIL